MPFHRVLIANRAEIARRVVRTCNQLGIESVALYSDADEGAPWLNEATHAVHLPGSVAAETYLNQELVLRVAKEMSCDAVHPGYGFLAENTSFSGACEAAGIAFVGPPADQIDLMGEKKKAQDAFASVGFPVLSQINIDQPENIDPSVFPIIIKASTGGGGIGMTLVRSLEEVKRAADRVRSTGERYFGSGDIYAERYLEHARHIEVQIVGDGAGAFHVGERDCSWQRRYQKVVEESPAPGVSRPTVSGLTTAAAAAAATLGYRNIGTIECLVEGTNFFFLEMNTRIQVEHPVTEMVYGVDLVKWQLLIAAGGTVPEAERTPTARGHAIEFRIYAEDPVTHMPSPGKIDRFYVPEGEGIRLETGYGDGSNIPMYYDPLVAKLVVHGATREAAIARSQAVLDASTVTGIKTNLPLLRQILASEPFLAGEYDTGSLGRLTAAQR